MAVALVLVVMRVGVRAGAAAVAALTLWVVGALIFYYPARLEEIVAEGLGVVLVSGFVVIFASLLREVERSGLRAQQANEHLTVLNAELTSANEQLRAAALVERDLVLAQERERTSRELHDGLGHRLTLVGMSLDYARRVRDSDPDAAWGELDHAATLNRETLDLMRRWVRALHPPEPGPDTNGTTSFEAIADSFRGTGLAVEVTYEGMPGPPPLPTAVSLLAHRFVQEGLTNVLRHADAGQVTIVMRQEVSLLEVLVRDDGDPQADPGEGFGRRNLRERAEAIGGAVTGHRLSEGGFELRLRVPLTEEGPRSEGAPTTAGTHPTHSQRRHAPGPATGQHMVSP